MTKKERFAVGAHVYIKNPGVSGVVTKSDDERTMMGEYWHKIQTAHGERREPGCNLELTPTPASNAPTPVTSLGNVHFHGDHARMNINSTDNSTNVTFEKNHAFFLKMQNTAQTISDEDKRAEILQRLDELEKSQGQGGFLHAYERFIGSLADHVTLFAQFLPILAHMIAGKL